MFGALTVAYLFAGGMGGGMLAVVSVLGLLSPAVNIASASSARMLRFPRKAIALHRMAAPVAYCRLFAPALIATTAALAFGSLCLVIDLGRPSQALSVFFNGAATLANFGSVALVAACLLALLQLWMWVDSCERFPLVLMRVVQVFAVVVGTFVTLYTGLLLGDMDGIVFWGSAFVPVLFVLSSFSSAFAALTLVRSCMRLTSLFAPVWRAVVRADRLCIAFEAAALAVFAATACTGLLGEGAQESMRALVFGDFAPLFWVGLAFGGLAVPFALECAALRKGEAGSAYVAFAASICVLLGALCLRYLVVMGGTHVFLGAWSAAGVLAAV